jgi:hypothetical protein
MELAQKEKATLEKWKKKTDPFKEWIVEAKGRFDNLQHGEGYDVIQEQHGKLEVKYYISMDSSISLRAFKTSRSRQTSGGCDEVYCQLLSLNHIVHSISLFLRFVAIKHLGFRHTL